MEYRDHYILAKYIADSFEISGKLNRMCFIWGNVTPDLNKFTYLHGYGYLLDRLAGMGYDLSLNQRRKLLIAGHTAEGARCYVNKFSRKLIRRRKWNLLDWYRFGKVVHYVTDRFTHPHTLGYREGFFKHVAYEEELHDRFVKLMEDMDRVPHNRKIMRNIVRMQLSDIELDSMYRAYRAEEISQENDCAYIIAACIKYVEQILKRRRLNKLTRAVG